MELLELWLTPILQEREPIMSQLPNGATLLAFVMQEQQ